LLIMSAPCDGAQTSQAHAQYHQLAEAEAWAAQNPQTPIFLFLPLFVFFHLPLH
jgi:hypothetical protein